MDKGSAKEKVANLVKEFRSIANDELDNKSEEQIKFRFIEPLFEALGWEKQDIEKESRVLKGRADYVLRLDNQDALVIEAKRTSVQLTEEEGRQAVSYAYHRKIKFAVLTNFREVRIYHALSNVKTINKNLMKDRVGYLWIKCENFVEQFDRLWLLSRNSFENLGLNKLLSEKDEKLYIPVDESILADLLSYREWLSKDLKKLRPNLSEEQIDEVVQLLIDRLIFMRSVEDRNLEEREFLLKIVADFERGRTSQRIWESLLGEFRRFRREYNSELFSEGLLEKNAFFDDDDLMKVIKGMYHGTSGQRENYMFDMIPVDLLGSIYEQYLGAILRGSQKRVKLESESGKRKRMGIYYTPPYIVGFIVTKTVGECVFGKNLDEILQVKVLDPACGSGSFLVRAFQELCSVIEERMRAGQLSERIPEFQQYQERLSLVQKKSILGRCIFGVDLDEKAVELTKLNLLLSLLENETKETRKLLLPEMRENIKCGNSLIDDRAIAGDRAFNWEAQFPDIVRSGGFDAVIGNPPYGAELTKDEKEHIDKKFSSKTKDTAAYFLERACLLSKSSFGFIVPKSIAFYSGWESIRHFLLEGAHLSRVLDVGIAFKDANYEEIVVCFSKETNITSVPIFSASPTKRYSETKRIELEGEIPTRLIEIANVIIFRSITSIEGRIIDKILDNSVFLGDLCEDSFRGLYIPDEEKEHLNRGRYKFINKVPDVSRYHIDKIISIDIDANKAWKEKASKVMRPRVFFKVLRGKRLVAYPDSDGVFLTTEKLVNFILKEDILEKISYSALAGILNSTVPSFFIEKVLFSMTTETSRVMDLIYSRYIPIPRIDDHTQDAYIRLSELVTTMLGLQRTYHEQKAVGHEKERLEQQIRQVDWEINELIYRAYGMTDEEKKVIEESLK